MAPRSRLVSAEAGAGAGAMAGGASTVAAARG